MKQVAAAIEFGTSKVVVLIGRRISQDGIEILGSGVCPYSGFQDKEWIEPASLAQTVSEAIQNAEKQAKKKIKELYVGVPGEYIGLHISKGSIYINDKDKKISSNDIDRLIDEAESNIKSPHGEIIHCSPLSFQIDGKEMVSEAVGQRGTYLDGYISFISADPGFIMDVKEIMNGLDLHIKDFIAVPFSEGIPFIPFDERENNAILIDMGYLNTDISIFHGDGLVYHSMIPLGGGHITSDLAIGLTIPMGQAEQLKRRYVFGIDIDTTVEGNTFDMLVKEGEKSRKIALQDVQEIIEARVEEIALLVNEELVKSKIFEDGKANVFLTGGGISVMQGARSFLTQILGMPVKIIAPKATELNSPIYTSALGVFDYATDKQIVSEDGKIFNFLNDIKNKFVDFF